MLVVHVYVHVKPEQADAFYQATIENARASVQEPGICRFDVIRQNDNPSRFVLIEVYRTGPYYHDGRAVTLRDALTRSDPKGLHGKVKDLTAKEIEDLIAYVLSL